jgi:hypothetical protein
MNILKSWLSISLVVTLVLFQNCSKDTESGNNDGDHNNDTIVKDSVPLKAEVNIITDAYLIEPGKDGMIIRWEMADTNSNVYVEYGVDTTNVKYQKLKYRDGRQGAFLYDANITDLEEGTTYYYRLFANNITQWYHFKTYKENQESFKFVAMGDSRSNPRIFSTIMKNSNNFQPDLIISMGDLVIKGGNYSEWGEYFFSVAKDYISSTPLVSTLGDHETELDNGALFDYFLRKDEPVDKQWFSFDYGNAHFISLDYRYPNDKEMEEWFINDITTANKKWNFVYMHQPTYNFGGHRVLWGRSTWSKTFQKYNVDLVFAGHSHLYERFLPVRPSYDSNGSAVTYVTTGGAGAELYQAVLNKDILEVSESVNHYINIDIDGNTLNYQAFRMDGSLLDEFTIVKDNGSYNSEYENSIISQELLNTVCIMNSAISSDIDKLPTDAEDGYCKIELMNFLTEDIPFTIKLNDNDDYYGVEPIIDVLKKRGRKNLTINIKKKKDYKVEHAQLVPELRFKIIYEYNNGKDSIIGKALNYWGK